MKLKNQFKKYFALLFVCIQYIIAYSQEVLPQPEKQAVFQPQNILFIGNSYTHMNKMPALFDKIAEAKGVKMHVEMNALSNHSFKMHSLRPELYTKLRERKWDYVVLQGFSRELSYPKEY